MKITPMPLRTTILRHQTEPEGPPAHFDWLLEPDRSAGGPDRRDVITWRCPRRPDRLEIGETTPILRISPHRRAWLSHSVGLERLLPTPLGSATVITRGEANLAGTLPLEVGILWSQSSEAHRYRIDETSPEGPIVLRMALRRMSLDDL